MSVADYRSRTWPRIGATGTWEDRCVTFPREQARMTPLRLTHVPMGCIALPGEKPSPKQFGAGERP